MRVKLFMGFLLVDPADQSNVRRYVPTVDFTAR